MIHILYMIDYLDFGGSEQHLYDLVTNLDPRQFKPHVMYFHGGYLSKQLETRGIELRRIPLEKINSYKTILWIPSIVGYVRDNKIQIVHTLHVKADIYGTLLARLARIPVIFSSRRDTGFTRSKRHIIFQNSVTDRFVSKVIVNSNAVKEAVQSREMIPADKIELIYNGIKTRTLHRDAKVREEERHRFGIRPNEVVVGTLATFNPVKRYDLVLRAAKDLKDNREIDNTRFLLVGNGKKRGEMERLCRLQGLDSRVIFAGHRKDIERVLAAMDIFVNFSDSEGFSNSILQAMAMSLPVIASDVGGNPEAVQHGLNGYLIPYGQYGELSRRVRELTRDVGLREKMGHAGRQKAITCFDIDRMIREFEEVYYGSVNPNKWGGKG